MIFVVEDLDGFGGCSIGWLSDYVTVKTRSLRTAAHEIGHACNLLHPKQKKQDQDHDHDHSHPEEEPINLMDPKSPRFSKVALRPWQIALLRSSRHVTLF